MAEGKKRIELHCHSKTGGAATKFYENRENFLIGSGTSKGRLYQSIIRGAEEQELKKIIENFDYVELLPGTEYEEYNKRIIAKLIMAPMQRLIE